MIISYKNRKVHKEKDAKFLSLVEKNQDKLYRIAYSYVKNKDDALDVVQETVYKGYLSYHRIKNPEYENTWLIKILINTAIDFLKKNKKTVAVDMNHIEGVVEAKNVDLDDKLIVENALDNLKDKEKAVVILRYFEDMKIDEIAEIFKSPVSSIKSILYRSLKKLEIDLREVGLDE